jgi:serine/threonine protein phosphatase PrpC
MQNRQMEYAWRTDKGRVRTINEDAVAVMPDAGLVVVADGIGGASAGEVASRLAVRVIGERVGTREHPPETREEAREFACEAVKEANWVIWDTARRSPRYSGMGTTVVVGFIRSGWMVYAHVGDSRLYLLREGELYRLTHDHSLIQEVVDQGFFPTLEDAQRYGINENIITRALGSAHPVAVDVGDVDIRPGDLFLFCTDGLTGMLSEDFLRQTLLLACEDLEGLSNTLIRLACEGGGLDNITLALMRAR